MAVTSMRRSSIGDFTRANKMSGPAARVFQFDYLVIGGGGGAGQGGTLNMGAGGGAGGYQCSVTGENSGGGFSAAPKLSLTSGASLTISIGAGGTTPGSIGTGGTASYFGSIYGVGGGWGAFQDSRKGGDGGSSGGGANASGQPGLAIPGQGYVGSNSYTSLGGGGGGAGGIAGPTLANGGVGVTSSITGSPVGRAGGGGGRGNAASGTATDGGGAANTSGTVNTGGGCGGGTIGRIGGSGLVVIKYPDSITLTIGAGLTSSTSTAGGFKTTTFTAGEDTVSF